MAQSLMNIGFGAALKPAAGLLGEFWRNRRGTAHPWEYVPQAAESREFLRNHAAEIERNLLEANPALDSEAVKANAPGTALVYDAWARNYAYTTQTPVADFYGRWRIDYESGRLVERAAEKVEQLEQTLYRDPEKDILGFFNKSRNRPSNTQQSFLLIEDDRLSPGLEIRIISAMPRHQAADHPRMDINENALIPDMFVQVNAENTIQTNTKRFFGWSHIGKQEINGKMYGHAFDINESGKITLNTFLRIPQRH